MQNWPRSGCCGGSRTSRPIRRSLVLTAGPAVRRDQSQDVQLEHANEQQTWGKARVCPIELMRCDEKAGVVDAAPVGTQRTL